VERPRRSSFAEKEGNSKDLVVLVREREKVDLEKEELEIMKSSPAATSIGTSQFIHGKSRRRTDQLEHKKTMLCVSLPVPLTNRYNISLDHPIFQQKQSEFPYTSKRRASLDPTIHSKPYSSR